MAFGRRSAAAVRCGAAVGFLPRHKRGNIGFHNLMKVRGEINMVDRSSNHSVEFITCKSLQQQQSMKCQLALQHIPNNSLARNTVHYQWFE